MNATNKEHTRMAALPVTAATVVPIDRGRVASPLPVHEQKRVATLRLVEARGSASSRQAAAALGLSRDGALARLTRLVEDGLLERDDSPFPTFTITPQGLELIRSAERQTAELRPADQRRVERVVERVNRSVAESARSILEDAARARELCDRLEMTHRAAVGRSLLAGTVDRVADLAAPMVAEGATPDARRLGPAVREVAAARGATGRRSALIDLAALCTALAADPALDDPELRPDGR